MRGGLFTLSADGGRREEEKGGKRKERRSNAQEECERRTGQEERVNLRTAVQTHFDFCLGTRGE